MKLFRSPWIFPLALVAAAPSAEALVAVGNGNYFTGFTDLEHDAPVNTFQLKVQRTYNSRSQFDGIFGFGWGSDFEAFLLPSADGSVVIQESGGGEKTRFSPREFSKAELTKQVDRLVAAYMAKEKGTGLKASDLKEKLLNDANERDEISRTLGVFPELPIGTVLYSSQRGDKQTVKVEKIGFVREFGDGKRELFNQKVNVADQGVDPSKRRILKGVFKLGRVADPVRKVQIFYEYNKKGQLESVSDKASQLIRFKYNDLGKVVEVSDKRGNKASYSYCETGGVAFNSAKKCGRGDLIRSRDTAGGIYSYQYDSLHNLTRIGNPKNGKADQEFEEIAYWSATSDGQGGVKSVKQVSGVLVEYDYWQDPKDKDGHFKTTVKNTYTSGRKSTTSYEYFYKKRADGSQYKYKLISLVDDEKTETIYNECCGQPLQITAEGGTTKFEYYPGNGLPKEKDSPSENVQWVYHPKFHGKITKVVVRDKQANSTRTSEFTYEEKNGQLVKARADGKGVVLHYDNAGRIASMVDQDKRKIVFKYSASTKPTEIVQEGVGSIQVTYDKAGQIKDVKSKGGRQIAISVAAAFQNLLEIIKPAGIQPI